MPPPTRTWRTHYSTKTIDTHLLLRAFKASIRFKRLFQCAKWNVVFTRVYKTTINKRICTQYHHISTTCILFNLSHDLICLTLVLLTRNQVLRWCQYSHTLLRELYLQYIVSYRTIILRYYTTRFLHQF